MKVRLTESGDIQPAQRAPRDALAVEQRVVQVQSVDKEDAAVDGDLQKRKNPGVATPGGPRDVPVGENESSVTSRQSPVKN